MYRAVWLSVLGTAIQLQKPNWRRPGRRSCRASVSRAIVKTRVRIPRVHTHSQASCLPSQCRRRRQELGEQVGQPDRLKRQAPGSARDLPQYRRWRQRVSTRLHVHPSINSLSPSLPPPSSPFSHSAPHLNPPSHPSCQVEN